MKFNRYIILEKDDVIHKKFYFKTGDFMRKFIKKFDNEIR